MPLSVVVSCSVCISFLLHSSFAHFFIHHFRFTKEKIHLKFKLIIQSLTLPPKSECLVESQTHDLRRASNRQLFTFSEFTIISFSFLPILHWVQTSKTLKFNHTPPQYTRFNKDRLAFLWHFLSHFYFT